MTASLAKFPEGTSRRCSRRQEAPWSYRRSSASEEWQQAHEALLAKEKEATRARDALAAERRRQPMTEFSPDYEFEGPDGEVSAARPLRGPPPAAPLPLLVPARTASRAAAARCSPTRSARSPTCTRATPLLRSSRPPRRSEIEAYKQRMGWDDPVVHGRRRPSSRRRCGTTRVLRARRLPARRRPRLPHLRDAQPRRRGARQRLDLPRPDAARPPGGVGGLAARATADAAVPVVAPARRVRDLGHAGRDQLAPDLGLIDDLDAELLGLGGLARADVLAA